MGRLDGKVALITGGARGQGAAEGALFVAEGGRVYLTDVLREEGAKTAADIGAAFIAHDVTSESDWARVVSQVVAEAGRVDVLVNNAGIFRVVPMTQTTVELWHQVMDINAMGVFLGMRAVASTMIAQQSGSIVNISSIAGLRGAGVAFAYGASKWAVRGMTKVAAKELGRYSIRVNSIHPGFIQTDMTADFPEMHDDDKRRRTERSTPLQRLGVPEDIANVALFLAVDGSSYCTGQEFVVDGGVQC